jgi:hypothetical protein
VTHGNRKIATSETTTPADTGSRDRRRRISHFIAFVLLFVDAWFLLPPRSFNDASAASPGGEHGQRKFMR